MPIIFLVCATTVWLSIRYAHCRQLIDQPGRRRSHRFATPRGGGIGIVVATLLGLAIQPMVLSHTRVLPWLGEIMAVALVAAVGWIDDHRGLSARWRLLAHASAALLVIVSGMLGAAEMPLDSVGSAHDVPWGSIAIAGFLVGFGLVWSINLHNFMDGINGLLACQAVFVFAALAVLRFDADCSIAAWSSSMFAAATLGFLPFNFPQARVFMGDVGSGVLGLMIAIVVIGGGAWFAVVGLIASSAFVTDATCTLLSRMLRGRRWYSAHREHLYQWLVRSGFSHAGVVGVYMAWNFIVVVPVLYVTRPAVRPMLTAEPWNAHSYVIVWTMLVYALAIVLWIFGKQWCLRKSKNAIKQEI